MASLHTRPVPTPIRPAHEHGWITESRHATSEGRIVYVRCTGCGARRVDLESAGTVPPQALSGIVPQSTAMP
ncbi:hypothetical protein [Microbacterium sp. CIAB417]|uniref:hypothetical protein n=1 Tax=Microbacterium sp. CIAB417 TaxID=2860287 RepID=UPI001FAB749B|nr:hypothetical protein [Microbacterium sp. CIAB417]